MILQQIYFFHEILFYQYNTSYEYRVLLTYAHLSIEAGIQVMSELILSYEFFISILLFSYKNSLDYLQQLMVSIHHQIYFDCRYTWITSHSWWVNSILFADSNALTNFHMA